VIHRIALDEREHEVGRACPRRCGAWGRARSEPDSAERSRSRRCGRRVRRTSRRRDASGMSLTERCFDRRDALGTASDL